MELLNDMALFVEVVNAKGFRGASTATGVPNSTLSRRIGLLEKAIGLRLLHRTTRKVELTEAGQLYYERCRRIVDEARIAHEQLGEMLAQPSGLLRVSLPVDFAAIFLAPLIAEFAKRYPGITFDFDLTPRRVDLVSESFDLAIRIGEQPNSGLIARQLAQFPARLYASPRYLEASGQPQHPAELEVHECIVFPRSSPWTLQDGKETVKVEVAGRFTINSVGMFRRMALLDQGVIMVPEAVVADDILSKQLVQVLPEWYGPSMPVYALTETRLLPAKTLRFIEFLQEQFCALPTR
ncbi:MAG: LysR family transcriptional regulator [Burkholderiaceae bacterium]|nr:LysR family transcriptional regulator [Burkholderiaceae bacterium]